LLPKRANSVIQRRLVIQLPREFLNNPEKNLEKLSKQLDDKYFNISKAFFVALHSGGKDFKNPHLHITFANVDSNYKNIRAYHEKDFLYNLKKDIANFITLETGVNCKVSDTKKPQNKHYQRWVTEAYKRAKKAQEQGDNGALMKSYIEKYTPFAAYVADLQLRDSEKAIKEREERIKKTAEKEIEKIKTMNEKIEKKANSWLYSKEQREELKQDILNNQKVIDNLKTKAKIDFYEELKQKELQRQKPEQAKEPTKEPAKQELIKELKQEPQKQEQKQEIKQDFFIFKEKEPAKEQIQDGKKDAFTLDLERRLNKSKGLER